jgi:hypothetical protein
MARQRTKADMARELDALRHQVCQLQGDLQRVRDENAVLMRTNHMLREDLNKRTRFDTSGFASRRDAMAAAREEAMRTGRCVKV